MSTRRWLIGTATALLLGSLALALRLRAQPAERVPPPRERRAEALERLAGTPSCSARGCHGGLEPAGGTGARQNEYTAWLAHDKHARAYEVLRGARARRMARNLAPTTPGGKEVPAHEDVRCLACHTTPLAAASGRADSQQDGVGCEACHGSARGDKPWLDAHTTASWKKLTTDQKAGYGMTPLEDPTALARACAGCHVGAPADQEGRPARDLNHDLMAAGHPRLDFELASFHANMPRHWRPDKHEQKDPGYLASLWATGQVESARASLELLASRAGAAADKQPWPEFAEYSCFACHADLRQKSWRQSANEGSRSPGSLPYNVWYSTLLPVLAPEDGLDSAIAGLESTMSRPTPEPKKVIEEARQGIGRLDALLKKTQATRYNRAEVKTLLGRLAGRANRAPRMTWDEVEQTALAVAALAEADRRLAQAEGGQPLLGKESARKLRDLLRALAFPPGSESPGNFRAEVEPHKQLQALLQGLPRS